MRAVADEPEYLEGDREFGATGALRGFFRRTDPPTAEERRKVYGAAGFDLFLALVVGVLCAIGLLMVYSASIDVSYQATGDSSNTTYFFVRQVRSMATKTRYANRPT